MIRALIIEDEKHAAENLKSLIQASKFNIKIVDELSSVSSTIKWLSNNEMPDLIFLDVQLADGISFEIFSHVKIRCPIIFTTAYQEYAIRAFRVNTVDYLLKPITKEDFDLAIKQYFVKTKLSNHPLESHVVDFKMDSIMKALTRQYKLRFVVNYGQHIKSVEINNIACFKSIEGNTFLTDFQGKSFDINYSLDQLESLLDPQFFFRINRKFVVNFDAIKDITTFSINRLRVFLKNIDDEDLIVSRNRIKDFKEWLER